MKRIYDLIKGFVAASLLLWTLSSCNKKEFMVPPEGEQVPYEDTLLSVQEALATSPYSLYWEAWQHSHMDSILASLGPKAAFTLLVPDDDAFKKAGLDLTAINNSLPTMLDSLLSFHATDSDLHMESLQVQPGSLPFVTLLRDSRFTEILGFLDGTRTYRYRHYLDVEDGRLVINGKVSGGINQAMAVKKGTILPINRLLIKPVKDIRQTLEDDGRFSLYLEFRAYNDLKYTEIGYISPVLDLFSAFENPGSVRFSSILAPTDEAFQRAGIRDLNDLIALNSRSLPYLMDDYFTVSGYLPSDSILNNHYWGVNMLYVHNTDPESVYPYKNPSLNAALTFYSNDLNNELLGNYITMYDDYTRAPLEVNNLEFMQEGDEIKVRVKGSDAEPATIVEKDIETLNGPIQVLDRLLIPKGFKLTNTQIEEP